MARNIYSDREYIFILVLKLVVLKNTWYKVKPEMLKIYNIHLLLPAFIFLMHLGVCLQFGATY